MTRLKPGPAKTVSSAELAERNRIGARKRSQSQSRDGQDIGPIPPVVNWQRRNACRVDLALFIKTYLLHSFPKPFSQDHLASIGKARQAVLHGGLFAQACPRGDGKTERTKATSLWAILYGHRKFALMIGATSGASEEMLDGVRFYLESSATIIRDKDSGDFLRFEPGVFPLLAADFPEAVFPILALEGESKRQGGQRIGDLKTDIHWGGKYITFPTVPMGNWIDGSKVGPAPSAGATIRVTGITGRIRGFNINGLRPDLVLPDDPQTEESARSAAGNAKIESILARAVIGLAGPGKKIAGIMPCTVIQRGDAIDNILSHDKHPEWDSARTKMLYKFPVRLLRDPAKPSEPSWEEYRDIRNNYNPFGEEGSKRAAAEEATLYYLRNSDALQEGAVVSWAERFADDELDALQHAMNLYFQDARAFASEYQNDPLPDDLGDVKELTVTEIAGKLSKVPKGIVPLDTAYMTAFIDVQHDCLFYGVCAWRGNFTGYVVDYGTNPKQSRPYFTKRDLSPTLAHVTKKPGVEAQIYEGLEMLTAALFAAEWKRESSPDGEATHARLNQCIVDSGYQSEVVYQFCRRSVHSAILIPSKGQFVGASSKKGLAEDKPKGSDRHGLAWVLPAAKESRGVRLLRFDTNFWKSFLHARLAVPIGSAGCLSLFGSDATAHRMLADHLTAEYRVKTSSVYREAEEWKPKPDNPDNDLLDVLAGCCVGASMLGVSLDNVHKTTRAPSPSKPVSFSAAREKARAGR